MNSWSDQLLIDVVKLISKGQSDGGALILLAVLILALINGRRTGKAVLGLGTLDDPVAEATPRKRRALRASDKRATGATKVRSKAPTKPRKGQVKRKPNTNKSHRRR